MSKLAVFLLLAAVLAIHTSEGKKCRDFEKEPTDDCRVWVPDNRVRLYGGKCEWVGRCDLSAPEVKEHMFTSMEECQKACL